MLCQCLRYPAPSTCTAIFCLDALVFCTARLGWSAIMTCTLKRHMLPPGQHRNASTLPAAVWWCMNVAQNDTLGSQKAACAVPLQTPVARYCSIESDFACRLASASGKDDDMEAAIAQVGIEVYSAMDAAVS